MLRVSFSSVSKATAAVDAFAAYGYSAERCGRHVVTDCPPLLAIPAIQKQVGFAEIERLDLNGRTNAPDPAADPGSEFGEAPPRASAERGGALRA
jgi:hypothetical protein